MTKVLYLSVPIEGSCQQPSHNSDDTQSMTAALAQARDTLLCLKDQSADEVKKHQDQINDILTLCASLASSSEVKEILLIPGEDHDELQTMEIIFNTFRIELLSAKDKKLEKMISVLAQELQLPPTPAAMEQVKRNLAARGAFLREYGAYSSGDIHRLNDSSATNIAALASGWRSKGRIFAIESDSSLCYPAFQFDDNGKPRKIIAEVIKLFDDDNVGWQLALWFTMPNALLDGKKPVDILESDPKMIRQAAQEEVDPTLY